MMATYMQDDGLGEWIEDRIDDSHVEWRRRKVQASEFEFGEFLVEISIEGSPPVQGGDFNPSVPRDKELESRVRQMKF